MKIKSKLDINMNLTQLLLYAESSDYLELVKLLHIKYGISYLTIAKVSKINNCMLSQALKRKSFDGIIKEKKADLILETAIDELRRFYLYM